MAKAETFIRSLAPELEKSSPDVAASHSVWLEEVRKGFRKLLDRLYPHLYDVSSIAKLMLTRSQIGH